MYVLYDLLIVILKRHFSALGREIQKMKKEITGNASLLSHLDRPTNQYCELEV